MIANHNHRLLWLWTAAALGGALQAGSSCAAEQHEEVQTMKRQIEALQKQMAGVIQVNQEKQKRIETLEQQVKALQEAPRTAKIESSLDKALAKLETPAESKARAGSPLLSYSATPGGARGNIRLTDVSVDMLMVGGTSTVEEEQLHPNLQGGCHDPKKRGFTIQQTELSFSGAVDPYFNFESHLVAFHDPGSGESGIELEEAFATTTSMPCGLQAKAGHFLTEFGRMNPTHPHTWTYLDQPIINSRLFGGDGLRNPGARLSWLTPAPWYSQAYFGIQNATGETARSLLGNTASGHHHHGGEEPEEETALAVGLAGYPTFEVPARNFSDMLFSGRWENSADVTPNLTALVGVSGLYGPNNTGPDGDTWIGGLDFALKWKPDDWRRTGRFVNWQSELMGRRFRADSSNIDGLTVRGNTLKDWGFYTQVEAGFLPRWTAGLRLEYASACEDNVHIHLDEGEVHRPSRQEDAFRDDRWRLSPLVAWNSSEFSRIRFQYNLDHAEHLRYADDRSTPWAHSFWIGLEVMIGAHPAHKY